MAILAAWDFFSVRRIQREVRRIAPHIIALARPPQFEALGRAVFRLPMDFVRKVIRFDIVLNLR